MLLKIKINFIVILLVILGCSKSNHEKIQNIRLNEKLANELSKRQKEKGRNH